MFQYGRAESDASGDELRTLPWTFDALTRMIHEPPCTSDLSD
jgi:hypothetical protein